MYIDFAHIVGNNRELFLHPAQSRVALRFPFRCGHHLAYSVHHHNEHMIVVDTMQKLSLMINFVMTMPLPSSR